MSPETALVFVCCGEAYHSLAPASSCHQHHHHHLVVVTALHWKTLVDQAVRRTYDIQVKIHDSCEVDDHRMVADNSGLADIPQGAHTLVLEDTPSGGARKQEEEEVDEQNWRAEVHRLLPLVVRNRQHCCSVVVGTADHPWGVGLSNYHIAAGNTRHTASRIVHGELWSCSLRKGAGSTNPAVGHVGDTPVETHGHHSVAAVKACIADHVHCLFSPEASAHMDLKDATVGAQPAPNVQAILLAVAQNLRILKNSRSSQSLESQYAFAASYWVPGRLCLWVLGHRARQGAHRPTVPLGVCQP